MDNFKILIVDDEKDFRETIIKRLKARKDRGRPASTAAPRPWRFWTPRTLMSSSWMSRCRAWTALKPCGRSRLKKPLVEVIMLTGHASVESGIQGMQLGAFDYVMKPVALDDLMDKVRQAYERRVIQLDYNR